MEILNNLVDLLKLYWNMIPNTTRLPKWKIIRYTISAYFNKSIKWFNISFSLTEMQNF